MQFVGSTTLRLTRDDLLRLVLPPNADNPYTIDPVDVMKHKSILVTANVTEGVSDVTLSGGATVPVKTQRYQLKYLSASPSSFKPGLLYNGFVSRNWSHLLILHISQSLILWFSLNLSVCVRKLQVAILARSSWEMSLTVLIVWQYILSWVRVSVWPSNFFICEKPRGNRVASACVYLNGQRPALSPAERAVTVGRHRIAIACTTAATAVCVCACARVCVRACVMCLQYTIQIFDPGW